MYAVSEDYKLAMKQPVQHFHLKGTVGEENFTDDNVLSGSFSITNQCCGNDAIELGQVYVGELNATFMNLPIPRYNWKNKEIKPSFGIRLANGKYEDIPLGVFTISSAEWSESGVVVKAYDHMALLDKPCNVVLTEVTPYQAVKRIEEETKVEFGNPEEDYQNFANGTMLISETTTNDVETWRDLVSWLAQTLGCFATAGRDGKIYFRAYSSEAVDTIDDKHRFTGCTFSDFETRYTGLSVVNMEDEKTEYYGLDVDDGLTMNLGSNPFLQYGIEATKEEMRRNILNALQAVDYVPFKAKAIGNPAYDLGDVLVFSNGLADGDKKYCITKYTFTFNSGYEMEGVGKDPALATARSKTDKNLVGLLSSADENTLVHYRFSNTKVIDIGDGKRETVASIRFATATKSSEVSLWAEILIDAKKNSRYEAGSTDVEKMKVSSPPTNKELQDEVESLQQSVTDIEKRTTAAEQHLVSPDVATVTVSYQLSGEELEYHPVETFYAEGRHILSLHYFIGTVNPNTVYTFLIMLRMDGGSATLDTNCVNAVIEGTGLAGTGKWDGTIDAEEKFHLSFSDAMERISDAGAAALLTPSPVGISEPFHLSLSGLFGGLKDEAEQTSVVRYFVLSDTEGSPDYNHDYLTLNGTDAFIFQKNYVAIGKTETVDEGFLNRLDLFVEYPELETLEEMGVS